MTSFIGSEFAKFQRDSYCVACDVKVVSCEIAKTISSSNKGNKKGKGGNKKPSSEGTSLSSTAYDVILEDTILFAENGGQPSDFGTINGIPVTSVHVREGTRGNNPLNIVHTIQLEKPFEVGQTVHVTVDWERRFDHMQQHTSQHLLTSIAADIETIAARNASDNAVAIALSHVPKLRKFETVGWELGQERSVVEFSLNKDEQQQESGMITNEEITLIETIANAAIRQHHEVSVAEYPSWNDIPDSLRSRGDVPKDSAIRVVTIEGYDNATCCGTHVRNTADLQSIMITGTEHARSGTIRLTFLAGGRIIRNLNACLEREKAMGKCFCCPAVEFPKRVETLFTTNAALTKEKKHLAASLVERDAEKLVSQAKQPSTHITDLPSDVALFTSHCNGASMEYLEQLVEQLGPHKESFPPNSLFLLTTALDNKCSGAGCFLITLFNGTEQTYVKTIAEKVKTALKGKGGGKGVTIQGKATEMEHLTELMTSLISH